MPIFMTILFLAPMALAEWIGWRIAMAFWALLFVGSAIIKLFSMVL